VLKSTAVQHAVAGSFSRTGTTECILTKVRFPRFGSGRNSQVDSRHSKTAIWKDGDGYPKSQRRMSMPGGSKDFDCLRQSMFDEVMFNRP
jgi:hypothetical protein